MPNIWTGKGNPYTRQEVVDRLNATLAKGEPIIAAGAGTGISAKFIEKGGADLIIIYNSGRFRMMGHGSTAGMMGYGDANATAMEIGEFEVLPVVKHTPVLAGVNGTDPFMIPEQFLQRLIDLGFSGIQNFPTVGLIDGNFRANLEETGMGYGLEVDIVARAHAMDLLTTPYAFDTDQATAMAKAGADVLVPHMGLTTSGTIGAQTAITLEEAAVKVQELHDAAKRVNPDILVLCHGGPIAEPDDAQYILDHTEGIVGFYGASSMERLPTEQALTETTRRFVQITR